MTDVKDNSSLPLLLSITGAIVAVAVGGWFLLNKQSEAPVDNTEIQFEERAAGSSASTELAASVATGAATESDAESSEVELTNDEKVNVDGELRKARLAAGAEILVLPAGQSALFYYGQVLAIDPDHEVANAERDAILARVSQTVSQHLAAGEYAEAYEIAALVAKQVPEHSLVTETQTTLDALTEDLVQQSISAAQDGKDSEADELLGTALALPGRNPRYFDAIRDSIAEIRRVRESAARDRARRARLAASDARAAWVERTRSAIAAGNLITPAGASASDLLAEQNTWESERAQLTDDLLVALMIAARLEIENGQLGYAEDLLASAAALNGDTVEIDTIRGDLETALVDRRSNRVVNVSDLTIVKSASPRYPKRARERGQSGWVDVYFTVTMNGETANISVANSEPNSIFDRAAMKAVEQWEFRPVEYRGQTIAQRAAARLVFVLE